MDNSIYISFGKGVFVGWLISLILILIAIKNFN